MSQERLDKLIVVFDREGYSAELYRYLDGRDERAGKRRALFISWAKYSDKWVNDLAEEQFKEVAQVAYERGWTGRSEVGRLACTRFSSTGRGANEKRPTGIR